MSEGVTDRVVVISCEASDVLDPNAQLIELAAVTVQHGRITSEQFHALLNPQTPIPRSGTVYHGHSQASLADCPVWRDVAAAWMAHVQGAQLLVWNANFHLRMLDRAQRRAGLPATHTIGGRHHRFARTAPQFQWPAAHAPTRSAERAWHPPQHRSGSAHGICPCACTAVVGHFWRASVMSQMVRNALANSFQLRMCCMPEGLRPLHTSLALLQYVLAPIGCTLDSFSQEVLMCKAKRLQQGSSTEQAILDSPNPISTHALLRDELLDCLAQLCAQLSQGRRCHAHEYRLIAIVYDRYNGVQDMRQLQERFDRAFHWIATDAVLRQIGNDSGFELMR